MRESSLILDRKLQIINADYLRQLFDFIQYAINLNKCNRLNPNIAAPKMKSCKIQAMPAA